MKLTKKFFTDLCKLSYTIENGIQAGKFTKSNYSATSKPLISNIKNKYNYLKNENL